MSPDKDTQFYFSFHKPGKFIYVLPKILADTILLIHLAFIVFVILGGWIVFYHRWMAWIHIPMVIWSSIVNLTRWRCPLTPLENLYRSAAGEAGYEGGFIRHYIEPLLYPEGLTYDLGILVGVFVFVWNALIYGIIVYRIRRT